MPEEHRRNRRSSLATSPRTALLWERIHQVVHDSQHRLGRPLRVVDLGGGTGGIAVPLAALGHDVTVVDPSPDALASLERRVREADNQQAASHLTSVQGDSATLAHLDLGHGADLITCHGVLELDDEPTTVLRDISTALAPQGMLSLLVAQRTAVVLARALAGRFAQARTALTSTDGRYGDGDPLPRRFDAATVLTLVDEVGLTVVDSQGLRVFTDLVPSAFLDTDAEREALLALERAISTHPDRDLLGRLGSALHVLARR
ncbi:tRNA 5-carboxymethoxyuridine methyltransferase [Austwickia sp. TVS 96-490-7B]|uniref:methyltransferase n=1 Tax=Austwickia sp. TVS 96-490-7B TaxID=2830843 RepID=UPI001C5704AD|nr:methyltransferase [Austwickia sp. TVS 96-490-7B]MBW3086120.1 tRNA 5-carboxymethoxyuridine methyltransferase [Austwickia sp. TVS 96-490-7B]